MKFHVRIRVRLKDIYFDPEGEATKKSLKMLGYPVTNVRVSKLYDIHLEANNLEEAKKLADEICKRLLANPVKDTYNFEVIEG